MQTITRKTACALIAGLFMALFGMAGPVRAEENTDDFLKQMPESMPGDYSDEEIDRMLTDTQQVDDSSDTEGKEATEKPDLSEHDKELLEAIENDPDAYTDEFTSTVWLNNNHVVIWHLCSNYAWLEAHPRVAARIYLNYTFWSAYPDIAYIIVCNTPFLTRYPHITMRIYVHDDWFILHPFVAREVYRNYVFFDRYPRLIDRYYRHHEWINRHPGIARIAYGNHGAFKSRPEYLPHVYTYRRHALQKGTMRQEHMRRMHERAADDARLRKGDAGKKREKYVRKPDDGNGSYRQDKGLHKGWDKKGKSGGKRQDGGKSLKDGNRQGDNRFQGGGKSLKDGKQRQTDRGIQYGGKSLKDSRRKIDKGFQDGGNRRIDKGSQRGGNRQDGGKPQGGGGQKGGKKK